MKTKQQLKDQILSLENQQQWAAQQLFSMKCGMSGRGVTKAGIAAHQENLDRINNELAAAREELAALKQRDADAEAAGDVLANYGKVREQAIAVSEAAARVLNGEETKADRETLRKAAGGNSTPAKKSVLNKQRAAVQSFTDKGWHVLGKRDGAVTLLAPQPSGAINAVVYKNGAAKVTMRAEEYGYTTCKRFTFEMLTR